MTLTRETLAELRFGLGPRPGLAPAAAPEALLGQLAAAAREDGPAGMAEDRRLWRRVKAVREARRAANRAGDDGGAGEEALRARARDLRRALARLSFARLGHAAETANGFGERMLRFWASHFAVVIKFPAHGSRVAGFADQALRPHLDGHFGDMLKAVVRHPAMLGYLDQHRSVGPNSRAGRREGRGMNENLAREVLELHTLGAGGPYGQADVQALAALLTGFSTDDGRYRWRRGMAEPGRFELLGTRRRGADEGETLAALDDLARHPATARHIARKLAVHFVSDAPPEPLVAALAARWEETGGDLAAVAAALLSHPAAWTTERAKVRPPQEALIAALRAAGARSDEIGPKGPFAGPETLHGLARMGQSFNRAPGPDGWPEAPGHWITPGGMAARLAWAARMGRALESRIDPRDFAEAALRDALSDETAFAVSAAAERWEGHALLLASPDFNRR